MFQANVRVSNNIRKFIELIGNRVYVGLSESCRVYDHFHVKRCNNCQKFNHYSDNCDKSNESVCARCAGNHGTDKCQNYERDNFIPTCYNCKLGKMANDKHEAFSTSCPTYVNAQDRLRKSIMYYSKNV